MGGLFDRTAMLIGSEALEKLKNSRVAVFGVGGVGGFTVEALARTGIGAIDLIDDDKVCLSNINRQIIATTKTLDMYKVDAAKERAIEINPDIKITVHKKFFTPQTSGEFDFTKYDYVVDAIDTISGKIEIIIQCDKYNVPVISSMGAGNKLDPTSFEVADIYKTTVCPLARVMRKELKNRGVKKLKVVYSKEPAIPPIELTDKENEEESGRFAGMKEPARKKQTPGSVAFVPSVAGLIAAGEVIKDLIKPL